MLIAVKVPTAHGAATMHWFRSRVKLGSWLALTALAIQLALSFAHVHLEGSAPLSARGPALAALQTTADTDGIGGAGTDTPALADEFCAICALIHLAGTAQTAAPPALVAPVAYRRIVAELVTEPGSSPPVHAPFSARAPPIA
jgi:hypothetical protein